MEWLKKHVDSVIILVGILGATLWMNGKVNEIEKDVAVIKTVLIMKDILPKEIAKNNKE
jgi:hypothetical protein